MAKRKSEFDEIRELAESDLWAFARLVNPHMMYGEVHRKVFKFLQHADTPNALLLLPRGHLKSHCVAVWCAWVITKNPAESILYVSATSGLAEDQLYAIKNILTCDTYSYYWPDMVNPDEGKREKWNSTMIAIDHPLRKEEAIRDMTIRAAGLETNVTGKHANILVADDVVVPDNAYTEEGRRKCAAAMSQLASVLNTGGIIRACGTRYHPDDIYAQWKEQEMPIFDDDTGELIKYQPLWEILEEVVETNGKFLWPRSARDDGKMYGFDRAELSRISAMYLDRTQFYSQYYNDPNDPESQRVNTDKFQYFDPMHIKQRSGDWYYKERKLNLVAAIDFAYTIGKRSDYTAIIVIGIDQESNIYVLDIDRFQTDKIGDYYDHIERLHIKWEFRKLRAEVTAAQSIIVSDLKDRIRENGSYISIDVHKPTRHQGSKEERIAAVLEPRYQDLKMWHFKGGYTPALEEELIKARPQHDDLKDCLASAVEIAQPPRGRRASLDKPTAKVQYNKRFGGVAFRG